MATLVLAESDVRMRNHLDLILRQKGHTVIQAPIGPELLAVVGRRRFDLVMLGLHQTNEEEHVYADHLAVACGPARMIVLWGGLGGSLLERAGFGGFFYKPVPDHAILGCVEQRLGRNLQACALFFAALNQRILVS